jgi:hypothetical protein
MPATTQVRTRVKTVILPQDLPTGHYKFEDILGGKRVVSHLGRSRYAHKNIWYAIADWLMVVTICLGILAIICFH